MTEPCESCRGSGIANGSYSWSMSQKPESLITHLISGQHGEFDQDLHDYFRRSNRDTLAEFHDQVHDDADDQGDRIHYHEWTPCRLCKGTGQASENSAHCDQARHSLCTGYLVTSAPCECDCHGRKTAQTDAPCRRCRGTGLVRVRLPWAKNGLIDHLVSGQHGNYDEEWQTWMRGHPLEGLIEMHDYNHDTGDDQDHSHEWHSCGRCNGTGVAGQKTAQARVVCNDCEGTGRWGYNGSPCPFCKGSGLRDSREFQEQDEIMSDHNEDKHVSSPHPKCPYCFDNGYRGASKVAGLDVCDACGGNGQYEGEICAGCKGSGLREGYKDLRNHLWEDHGEIDAGWVDQAVAENYQKLYRAHQDAHSGRLCAECAVPESDHEGYWADAAAVQGEVDPDDHPFTKGASRRKGRMDEHKLTIAEPKDLVGHGYIEGRCSCGTWASSSVGAGPIGERNVREDHDTHKAFATGNVETDNMVECNDCGGYGSTAGGQTCTGCKGSGLKEAEFDTVCDECGENYDIEDVGSFCPGCGRSTETFGRSLTHPKTSGSKGRDGQIYLDTENAERPLWGGDELEADLGGSTQCAQCDGTGLQGDDQTCRNCKGSGIEVPLNPKEANRPKVANEPGGFIACWNHNSNGAPIQKWKNDPHECRECEDTGLVPDQPIHHALTHLKEEGFPVTSTTYSGGRHVEIPYKGTRKNPEAGIQLGYGDNGWFARIYREDPGGMGDRDTFIDGRNVVPDAWVQCEGCDGDGQNFAAGEKTCRYCNGTGTGALHKPVPQDVCRACHGSGKEVTPPECPNCGGSGIAHTLDLYEDFDPHALVDLVKHAHKQYGRELGGLEKKAAADEWRSCPGCQGTGKTNSPIPEWERCDICNGSGLTNYSDEDLQYRCKDCGHVDREHEDGFNHCLMGCPCVYWHNSKMPRTASKVEDEWYPDKDANGKKNPIQPCPQCHGTAVDGDETCTLCNGTGLANYLNKSLIEHMKARPGGEAMYKRYREKFSAKPTEFVPCIDCHGGGIDANWDACETCSGSGLLAMCPTCGRHTWANDDDVLRGVPKECDNHSFHKTTAAKTAGSPGDYNIDQKGHLYSLDEQVMTGGRTKSLCGKGRAHPDDTENVEWGLDVQEYAEGYGTTPCVKCFKEAGESLGDPWENGVRKCKHCDGAGCGECRQSGIETRYSAGAWRACAFCGGDGKDPREPEELLPELDGVCHLCRGSGVFPAKKLVRKIGVTWSHDHNIAQTGFVFTSLDEAAAVARKGPWEAEKTYHVNGMCEHYPKDCSKGYDGGPSDDALRMPLTGSLEDEENDMGSVTVKKTSQRMDRCPKCVGVGQTNRAGYQGICDWCRGSGIIDREFHPIQRHILEVHKYSDELHQMDSMNEEQLDGTHQDAHEDDDEADQSEPDFHPYRKKPQATCLSCGGWGETGPRDSDGYPIDPMTPCNDCRGGVKAPRAKKTETAQAKPIPPGDHLGDNGIDDPMKHGDMSKVKTLIPGTQRSAPGNNNWNVSVDNLPKTGKYVPCPFCDGNGALPDRILPWNRPEDCAHGGDVRCFDCCDCDDCSIERRMSMDEDAGGVCPNCKGSGIMSPRESKTGASDLLILHCVQTHGFPQELLTDPDMVTDSELQDDHIKDHIENNHTHNPEVLRVATRTPSLEPRAEG